MGLAVYSALDSIKRFKKKELLHVYPRVRLLRQKIRLELFYMKLKLIYINISF
jgi:hypothetical protein